MVIVRRLLVRDGLVLTGSHGVVLPLLGLAVGDHDLRWFLCDAVGCVLFHLSVESCLVLRCHVFVPLLLFGWEISPTFSEHGSHLDEFEPLMLGLKRKVVDEV